MEKDDKVEFKQERDIFGSFSLCGTEFAISVKSIQEVVNEPASYNPVPLAPSYLLGLFNLRGMIIPVVDLRKVFNFSDEETSYERKIAIIEHGNLCVGLLFDFTCEVFNGNEVERSQFNQSAEEQNDQVVQGVFKLDNGKRVIQILDPYEILNLNDVPKSDDSVATSFQKQKKGKKSQCISFQIGDATCALGIDTIQEIVNVSKIDNTALSNDICLGAINIRENTIPVINFEKILGYKTVCVNDDNTESERRHKIVIMRLEDELFGLLVNTVENIISYYDEDVIKFPVLSEEKKEMFIGCISQEDGDETILLDHSEVLSHSEVERITRGHSQLYKENSESAAQLKQNNNNKKTYITFSIDNNYALGISEVNEVIDYTEDILVPPGLSKHFRGMLNLRGDMIAIIDPRILYQIKEASTAKDPKVLIFKINDVKYGFLVDSVDSIVSFQEDEMIMLPEIVYKGSEKSLSADVKEAIQVNGDEEDKTTLLALNLDAISSKVSFATAS
jgi:purine-binding chemotaxis protein CheW